MSVRTDVINLTVNINGDKGKNELNQLRKRAAELAADMRTQERRTVEGRKAWADMNKELQSNQTRQAELRKQIGLTALSQKELTAELKKLQQLKNIATPQTKEFFDLQKQIDAVSVRLKDVRNGTFGFKAMLGSIKDEVKQFGMLAASYLGFQFVTDQARDLIRAQKSMADENANIAKTTGLAKDKIRDLNKEIRGLDTRTSNSQLRQLAAEAGKLGKSSVEDIKRFVSEANTITVALGEDLGEEAIPKLAKVAAIFGTEMTNVASGINSVGQASAATESYQVDFAFRMAGTAQTARLAAGDILGFAAALELNGQQTEMAATALNTFFLDFISKSDEFGRAAGFAKGQLAQLINDRGVNDAFLQWLQRLKDASPTTEAFIEKMRSLGIDGARGSNVLLVLSENIGLVREQQALANTEIERGTSVINEYNEKNNNFAATVDKISKKLNTFFTSDSVNGMVTSIVNGFGKLLDVLPKTFDFVGKNILAFGAWTAAIIIQAGWFSKLRDWISLTITGLKGQTAAQILATAAAKADIIATTALGVAKALLTGNMAKLRQEWLLMNAAIGTNPFAVLLIAVGALIVAYNTLIDRQGAVSNALKAQTDVARRSVEIYASQVSKVQEHVAVLRNEGASLDQKKKALSDLIALSPQYLAGLNLQNATTAEGKRLIDQYVLSLRRKAEEEARSGVRSELLEKQIKARMEADRLQRDFESATTPDARSMYYKQLAESGPDRTHGTLGKIAKLNQEAAAYGEQLSAIDKMTASAAQKTMRTVQITTAETTRTVGDVRAAIQKLDEEFDKIDAKDKARIKANRDQKKALETELAHIEGRQTPGEKSAVREGTKAENKLRQLRQDFAKLKLDIQQAAESGATQHQAEDFGFRFNKLLEESKKFTFELGGITKEAQDELNKLFFAPDKKVIDENYQRRLQVVASQYEQERQLALQNFDRGLLDRQGYSDELERIEEAEARDRANVAEQFREYSKKAADDVEKYKTDALEKGMRRRLSIEETESRNRIAQAELAVVTSAPGSAAELEAQKNLLRVKHEEEIKGKQLTNDEIKVMQAQLHKDLAEMDKQYYLDLAARIVQVLQNMANVYSEYVAAMNAKDQEQLTADRQANDDKKKHFQRQLDNKKISRATYDNEIRKLDADMEMKEREARKRQAKRDKSAALFSAIIGTAAAVINALQLQPFWLGLAMAAVAATMGGVQISKISQQKEPTGRRGLIVPGPSHEDQGVDLVERKSGKTLANVEGGEPLWVFSKETYKNNKDILDELIYNSMNKNGARIGAGKWYQRNDQQINTARIIPLMRAGGNVATGQGSSEVSTTNNSTSISTSTTNSNRDTVASGSDVDMGTTNALLAEAVAELRANRQEIATMKRELKAKVYIKDIQEAEDLLKMAQSIAGINQAA